jgi:uncharacterized SAM-binding protein YcdF (DUF218 family)/glycosyltransferase involved in cell wall biosynthesis
MNRQTNQRVATAFAAAGHRVLFVENTGIRAPGLRDLGRIRERIQRWLRSTRGFQDIQPNITVLSPVLLPFPYSRPATVVNRFLLSRVVVSWMRSARFGRPIVITFLPTPLAQALIRDVEPAVLIYYCANDMAGPSSAGHRLRRWEDKLFREADAVFVISEALRERAALQTDAVYSFPTGVEFEKFDSARIAGNVPSDLAALSHPIAGYVGALTDVFDQDLLVDVARRMPEVTFVLVGRAYTDISRLRACSNVKLLGERPHDLIPAYINGFDVSLIPYVKTPYADSVYSCKLNEYLAMGVPVVSTNMREMRHFIERHGAVVEIANDTEDFAKKVSCALKGGKSAGAERRVAVSKINDWSRRFGDMSRVIDTHLQQRMAAGQQWKGRFLRAYRRHRVGVISRVATLAAAYLLVFHTPLVWLAGSQLSVAQPPKPAGAIVVFSGSGASTYINPGYQRRARDAAQYYKAGYAPLLVISSAVEQTFAEVEIVKALLVSQGVPANAIQIITKYPTTTRENVELARDVLKERGVTSILFITAPYHSRRATLLWRKNAPEIAVVTVPAVDTPPATPQWAASIDQIRAIGYEYLAIAYNRARGWL